MVLRSTARWLRLSLLLSVLGALALAQTARADVLPPNDCTDPEVPDAAPRALGQTCTTAGPDFDQDGVCVNATYVCGGGPDREAGTCTAVLCELVDGGTTAGEAGARPPQTDSGARDGGKPTSEDASPASKDAAPTKDAAPAKPDAAHPTRDAEVADGAPRVKDSGHATVSDAATTELSSSSGCAITGGRDQQADDAWLVAAALGLVAVRRRPRSA